MKIKQLGKESVCYAMSRDNTPRLVVDPGETFGMQTEDCYSGKLQTARDKFTKDMWNVVNPATGPVFIDGAEPGDILRVRIKDIGISGQAAMCLEHGAGALADLIEGVQTTILPISNGEVSISDGLSVPARAMIGVIGVAPAGPAVTNSTPGPHGGNMDCKEIAAGSQVYLPVSAPGGLLAMGDLHALMGDGEVCICAAEVSGTVTLSVDILKAVRLPTPAVETDEYLLLLASAETLDECQMLVLGKAHRFLTDMVGLAANQAARVMSLLGELRVCQVVDPLKTMKFLLPKTAIAALDVDSRVGGIMAPR